MRIVLTPLDAGFDPSKTVTDHVPVIEKTGKFSDSGVLEATLKRQREHYRKPTLGVGGSLDSYKEYDPDRMKLLPIALLLFAGREREQLGFMARDPNPVFRACFLEVAPKAGDLTHLPFILESTTDPFVEVRQRAFRALGNI